VTEAGPRQVEDESMFGRDLLFLEERVEPFY
jgi:hypothetical protein